MKEHGPLVLEILKQEPGLKMSLFEQKEAISTVKHFSQCSVIFPEVDKLCQEIISILNSADKYGALTAQLYTDLVKSGQLLWDYLLSRSVKEKLKAIPVADLTLSLDEELIHIPWELLHDGEVFLCLKFNLGRSVRTRFEAAAVQYRSFSSIPKMLILANPTSDLKSAYSEGLTIKNQFYRRQNVLHIDFKSTNIDRLYVKKNLRDYDIVHFAGHCEYSPDVPDDSGWVLSDGKLSVAEILAMGSTGSLPNLIFSNACHSALSCANLLEQDCQQRAYSVASAFLFSGVRHYIGAIRKIEDPLSLNFARQFYTHLISGNSMGEAIRLSRLKLIHDCGSRSVHWTSYLLYGDPNFILFRPRGPALSAKGKKAAIFRSRLAWVGLSLGAISLSLYLYMWLPTLNPGTYYLFLKSKSSFLKGANSQVIATAKKITLQDPQFLPIYPLLGDTYQRLGDREKALKYYFDYALFSEKKQDKKNLASAFNGIGWIYYLQGDYARSKEFYELALGISRQNHDLENEADVLGKLAIWHLDKKDYDQALELLTKSSEINRDRQHIYRHKYNLACDYFNLGLLFTEKDDFSTAGEFYNKSFHLFKKLKMKHELSDYYFNMGEIYSFQKEYQKALDQYHKGLAIDLSQQNKPSLAADYNMLGELYLNMDNFTTAEKYFQDAAGLAREINAKPELAGAYYNLGLLYSKIGRKNKARENLRAAQEIYRGIDSCLYQDIKEILLALDN